MASRAEPAECRPIPARSQEPRSRAPRNLYKREDPVEAERNAFRRSHRTLPGFLTYDDGKPDGHEAETPPWTRDPVDWREDADLCNGEQRHGLRSPGAAGDENPCAWRLRLSDNGPQATRARNKTGHETAWVYAGWTFTPLEEKTGYRARRGNQSRTGGTVIETEDRVEVRRNDTWRTLLSWFPKQAGGPTFVNEQSTAELLAGAALTLSHPWPQGPPTVQSSRQKNSSSTSSEGTQERG